MHHEEELSDDIKQAMSEQGLGATGRFPAGRLTENDEGELAFQIGTFKGRVVINFGKPVASLGITPQQAREMAGILRRHADRLDNKPGPAQPPRRFSMRKHPLKRNGR